MDDDYKNFTPNHRYIVTPSPNSPTLAQGAKNTKGLSDFKKRTGQEGVNLGVGVPLGEPPAEVNAKKQEIIKGIKDYSYDRLDGGDEIVALTRELMIQEFDFPETVWRSGQQVPFHSMPCNGVKEGLRRLYEALAIKQWLVPVPCWLTNHTLIEKAGAELIPIQCLRENDYKMTPEQLEEYARRYPGSGLLFTNPNNPTSVVYDRDILQKFAPIILEHLSFVGEDGIYNRVISGERPPLLAAVDPRIAQFYAFIGGFAKDLCYAGNRPGTLWGPSDVLKSPMGWASEDRGNLPLDALACLRVCLDRSPEIREAIKNHIKNRVETYDRNRDIVREGLAQIGFSSPKDAIGGLYVWGYFPMLQEGEGMITPDGQSLITNTEQLNDHLLTKGVGGIPGNSFYPKGFPAGGDEMRFSLGLESEAVQLGVNRIVSFVGACRPKNSESTFAEILGLNPQILELSTIRELLGERGG